MVSELSMARDLYHESVAAFITGDPDSQKPLWSQHDDVTLANPLGPPVKGFDAVCEVMDAAAALVSEGDGYTFDLTSIVETADLAYEVGIESSRLKMAGSADKTALSLRVTTIFRREDDAWKIVHRHADSITSPRSLDSVAQDSGSP